MHTARPMVNPGMRRVWRDTRTLQFGVDVSHPVIVQHVDASLATMLDALDGTLTRTEVLARATSAGVDPLLVNEVIAKLEVAGVIVEGATWPGASQLTRSSRDRLVADHNAQCLLRGTHDAVRRRERLAKAHVSVFGVGRLGSIVCTLLTASGIGNVTALDDGLVGASDLSVPGFRHEAVGKPRRLISEEIERWRCAPGGRTSPSWFVVTNAVASRTISARLFNQGAGHLVVGTAEEWGSVGPLVIPGETSCLRCLDLNRGELDRSWPTIAAQLDPVTPALSGDSNLVAATAAIAVMHLLEAIDGRLPPSRNGVTFVQLPHGTVTYRPVPPSPTCGCAWPIPQDRAEPTTPATMVA